MITEYPEVASRDGHAEVALNPLRRAAWLVSGIQVGLLVQRHAVDSEQALRGAAKHVITRHADHALDVVGLAHRRAEQPADGVESPAGCVVEDSGKQVRA